MGRKEKKIDWLLSIVGFGQLCVLGVTGALYTEFTEADRITDRFINLAAADVGFSIFLIFVWFKTYKKTEK
jgi:hypothetical protein